MTRNGREVAEVTDIAAYRATWLHLEDPPQTLAQALAAVPKLTQDESEQFDAVLVLVRAR